MIPAERKNFEGRQFCKSSVAAVIGMLLCGLVVSAQSGRRGATKSTTTAPSVSGPKEVDVSAKPQKPAKLQLMIGIEDPNPMNNTPYYLSETVINACIARLDDSAEVTVKGASHHWTRGEAIKAAREEKERFVVLLQIGSDTADAGRQTSNGANDLYVSYEIFEPITGKIRQRGRASHGIYKIGNVGVSGPTTSSKRSAVYSEYAIKQSARDAAERILAAFDIKLSD